jgi:hypothetical protein
MVPKQALGDQSAAEMDIITGKLCPFQIARRGAALPPVACIARSFRKAQRFMMDMDIDIGLFDIIGVMGTIDIETDKKFRFDASGISNT